MTRGQRWIILIGLALIACLLHIPLVDWAIHDKRAVYDPIFLSLEHEPGYRISQTVERTSQRRDVVATGLFPNDGVSRSVAVIFGLAVPLALITLDAWLLLGWRRSDRITRGLCGSCGHDLQGADHQRCPECGVNLPKYV